MKNKASKMLLVLTLLISVIIAGCGNSSETAKGSSEDKNKPIILGHVSATCEAPLFIAYENGYFKNRGLNVELFKIPETADKKEILATNKVNVTDGVLATWLKALEQGVDMKFTGGTHTGCISMITLPNSDIKKIQDLKGKTVGVSGAIGGGAMNYAFRALVKAGLDPQKDVIWKSYPSPQMLAALEKGEIVAAAGGDTLNLIWVNEGKAALLASMAKDDGFKDETCCLIAFNSQYIAQNPETAKAITEAINEATNWVKQHPEEAAKILVDKKHVLGTVELNTDIIKSYRWNPDLNDAKTALHDSATEFKQAGILGSDADTENYVSRYFVDLAGLGK